MENHRVFTMKFASIYPLLVQKAERKHRTRQEVDTVICWLTGYNAEGIARQLERDVDYGTFLREAPGFHPNAALIRGKVCGVAVESIEDPWMQKVRWLDKLIDELAKGWPLEKILRS